MSEHAHASQSTETQEPIAGAVQDSSGSTPLLANGIFDVLQQGIGNHAVGRIMQAQRAASVEEPTTVSPSQQSQIDTLRGGGLPLEGLPDVRLHTDAPAAALAAGLNARAFTQGRDIFFGEDWDPSSQGGRATLAHELTHVVQGRTGPNGLIQREPLPPASAAPAAPNQTPAGPNQSVEPHYNLSLSTGTFNDLTQTQALLKLAEAYNSLDHALSQGSGEHHIVYGMRFDGLLNAIGAMLTEITGQNFPELDIWNDCEKFLYRAQLDLIARKVESAALDLKDGYDAYQKASKQWEDFKNQLDSAKTKAYIAIGVTAVVIIAVAAVAVVLTPAAVVTEGAVGTAAAGTETAAGTTAAAAGTETAAGTTAAAAGTETAAGTTAAAAGTETAVGGGAATIPEVAVGVGETLPGAGAGLASETGPLMFQELLSIYRAGGALAVRAAARGMSAPMLEKLLTFITVKLIGAGPLTQREVTIVDEIYEIILPVWQQMIGLPGTAPP